MFISVNYAVSAGNAGFNTSYVNVYLDGRILFNPPVRVSIHPMLMFILASSFTNFLSLRVSIHPMLMFIEQIRKEVKAYASFQYILC